jgi:hypothetical protein
MTSFDSLVFKLINLPAAPFTSAALYPNIVTSGITVGFSSISNTCMLTGTHVV